MREAGGPNPWGRLQPPPTVTSRVRPIKSSKPIRAALAALAAAILAAGGWLVVSRFTTSASPAPESSSVAGKAPEHAPDRSRRPLPAGWSYIAVARGRHVNFFRKPASGQHPVRTLSNPTIAEMPLTLLVKRHRRGWVQTYLPVRPNHSTAWVRRDHLRLLTTAYALHVHLKSHVMTLAVGERTARRFPIGVGRSVSPTPHGRYFITDLLRQPNPEGEYGPFVFGLSAHSGVYRHFGRGGDGQIGIHGTDEPWLIGENVSHGCIRVRNSVITWLAHRLPLGTPVTIGE